MLMLALLLNTVIIVIDAVTFVNNLEGLQWNQVCGGWVGFGCRDYWWTSYSSYSNVFDHFDHRFAHLIL